MKLPTSNVDTQHLVYNDSADEMSQLPDRSVELVVTSPPYPMVEMWDGIFGEQDPEITERLEQGGGWEAFELMHELLDQTVEEMYRVLDEGGIACINIGDATRRVDGDFHLYPNHSRVLEQAIELGFDPLPMIHWRKPNNSPNAFVGSGMIPTNQYTTLGHEYILVLRKGGTRSFPSKHQPRYESAYFWEERNRWFTDSWDSIPGRVQSVDSEDFDMDRERSAAYPLQIPWRLVQMFSIRGDTVLDPFWGTGTTTKAALVSGRNSIGYDIDRTLIQTGAEDVTDGLKEFSSRLASQRMAKHSQFVDSHQRDGNSFTYTAEHYNTPVKTKQERQLKLYSVGDVTRSSGENVAAYAVDEEFVSLDTDNLLVCLSAESGDLEFFTEINGVWGR